MDENTINLLVYRAFCALDQQNNEVGDHTHINEIILLIASQAQIVLTYKQVRDALYRLRVQHGLSIYHHYMGRYDTFVRAVQF